VPYLSASEVIIHEEALYQAYVPYLYVPSQIQRNNVWRLSTQQFNSFMNAMCRWTVSWWILNKSL